MNNQRDLTKVIKVSDPENWNNQDTVTVTLRVHYEHELKTFVRLRVGSVVAFVLECSKACFSEAATEHIYKLMKENMFDTLPEEVSYKWFLEHGYFPYPY
jgi:hypothetical protein